MVKIDADTIAGKAFLSLFAGKCLLSGGAVRDQLLGSPVRDYDFYTDDLSFIGDIDSLGFREIGSRVTKAYQNPDIYKVYQSGNVEVIFLEVPPKSFIEDSFCTDFCKSYVTVKNSEYCEEDVVIHKGFQTSVDNKFVWVDPSVGNANFAAYVHKLMYKYPEYKYGLSLTKGS